MDTRSYWIILILLLIVTDLVFMEPLKVTTTRKPKKKKVTTRKKLNPKLLIQCFECFRDFSQAYHFLGNDICFNPMLDPEKAVDEILVTCPRGATICEVDVISINGVFASIERKCALGCACICKGAGFGAERETCSECSLPVDFSTFDNETQIAKTCVMPVQRRRPESFHNPTSGSGIDHTSPSPWKWMIYYLCSFAFSTLHQ